VRNAIIFTEGRILSKVAGTEPENPGFFAAEAIFAADLALLYQSQGHYAEAEPLYKRALAIAEKVPGPEHPNVAAGLNNLAGLYHNQGRNTEAKPLYKRALAIDENALGPEHPTTKAIRENLRSMQNNLTPSK
jgi:tetratricopeptide (TPR) repeat protein